MKKSKLITLSLSVAIASLTFSGCANKDPKVAQLQEQLREKSEMLSEQKETEAQKEAEINKLKEELAKKSTIRTVQTQKTVHTAPVDESLTPPNAKLGECYAKVLLPAEYATDTKKKLLKEKAEKLTVTPATYKNVQYKILDKEASYKYIVKPATYKCVLNRVMVAPEKTEYKVIPATYKTVTEKVLVSPARQVWKKGTGPITKLNNHTGEIMCLIEEPAKYKTVQTKVVETPAHVEKIVTPAKYKNIRAKVVAKEASYEKVAIPAKYKVVTVQELQTKAKINKIEGQDVYQEVKTTRLVKPEELKWKRILCKTNTTKDVIKDLQRELKKRKYYNGPIDGIYAQATQKALNAFQIDNKLPSGALTLESLDALGVK